MVDLVIAVLRSRILYCRRNFIAKVVVQIWKRVGDNTNI